MQYKRIDSKCNMYKGWGYERGIMEDGVDDFKYLMFFANFKLILMIALSKDYWYDETPDNKLTFTYKNGTIYLRRLAINIK